MRVVWVLVMSLVVVMGQGIAVRPAMAAEPHILNLALIGPGVTCTEALAKGANTVAGAIADGSQGIVLCVHVEDVATNTDQGGIPVIFTVSVGTVGATGTTKSTTVLTSASGVTSISYRGAGNVAGADTAVASYIFGGAIATEPIVLAAATGRSASKMVMGAPSVLAIAPSITSRTPQYRSPASGSLLTFQVLDESGVGVNNQTVLVTVDRGAVIANPAFAATANVVCAGATAKSIAIATAATNLANPGGQATPGYINVAVCGDQAGNPGKIMVTAQNMSTPMANVTASVSHGGRPAMVAATAVGNAISVRVSDADGNPVADGTPIRFTMPPSTGTVSATCVLSTNGAVSTVVALSAATGTVLVSADYNETGAASTCVAAGTRQVAASVVVGGAAALPGSAPVLPQTAGAGTAASNSIPAAGGFGFIVFNGGTLAQLVAASGCPMATAAFYFTVGGGFVSYVPAAPVVVNAGVLANFAGGTVPVGTPALGRCG